MKYFDFDSLKHTEEILKIFLLVGFVYILIFGVSYVYNYLSRK